MGKLAHILKNIRKPKNKYNTADTVYCDRCQIRTGKKEFAEPMFKVWKFNGCEFILCLSCFKNVRHVKKEEDFSRADQDNGWYRK